MRNRGDRQSKQHESWDELDEHERSSSSSFLPDEQSENNQTAIVELRTRVNKLEQQVHALYTAMASYATIAERNTETARQEARADLDRSQSTLVGLIEKVRRDLGNSSTTSTVGYGAAASAGTDKVLRLDERIDQLAATVEQLVQGQAELHRHVARLVERDMAANGWLVSDGPADRLALH